MAQTGTVTATELRLRSAPSAAANDNVIKRLPKGTRLDILDNQGEWLKVSAGAQQGFVSAAFVHIEQESPGAAEHDDDGEAAAPANGASTGTGTSAGTSAGAAGGGQLKPGPSPVPGPCKFVGNKAVSPDGKVFATRFKLGVFNFGATSIGGFVAAHPAFFPDIKPSRLRIMQAVSSNEGKLEAINTWDDAFLTFGCFQWTIGSAGGAGELPPMIARLKAMDAAVFQKYFGQFGLDVSPVAPNPNVLQRGFFKLNGTTLNTPQLKAKLRTIDWAYRFWLAGQDDTVRLAQVRHAMDRVDLFFRCPECLVNTRFVGDYVSSEYGVALLLDQHVNRPGHVPGTLQRAVSELVGQLGADKPQSWQDAQEAALLKLYLKNRAGTSMTDSDARAKRILDAVNAGLASNKRGSYEV